MGKEFVAKAWNRRTNDEEYSIHGGSGNRCRRGIRTDKMFLTNMHLRDNMMLERVLPIDG